MCSGSSARTVWTWWPARRSAWTSTLSTTPKIHLWPTLRKCWSLISWTLCSWSLVRTQLVLSVKHTSEAHVEKQSLYRTTDWRDKIKRTLNKHSIKLTRGTIVVITLRKPWQNVLRTFPVKTFHNFFCSFISFHRPCHGKNGFCLFPNICDRFLLRCITEDQVWKSGQGPQQGTTNTKHEQLHIHDVFENNHCSQFLQKRVDFLQLMVDSQTAGKTKEGEDHTEKGEASQMVNHKKSFLPCLKTHPLNRVLCRSERPRDLIAVHDLHLRRLRDQQQHSDVLLLQSRNQPRDHEETAGGDRRDLSW